MNFVPQDQESLPLGGRTRHFRANWKRLTKDRVTLELVTGLRVEWLKRPSYSIVSRGPKFNADECRLIDLELTQLLTKQVVTQVTQSEPQFLGHIFLVPKKDGGMRPVYNMKPLNGFIEYHHFKMETLAMVKTVLQENDFMVKVDLKDAYQCIPVHMEDQPFMRFLVET